MWNHYSWIVQLNNHHHQSLVPSFLSRKAVKVERINQCGADSSQVPRVPSYLCQTFRKGFSFWYLTFIIWLRWAGDLLSAWQEERVPACRILNLLKCKERGDGWAAVWLAGVCVITQSKSRWPAGQRNTKDHVKVVCGAPGLLPCALSLLKWLSKCLSEGASPGFSPFFLSMFVYS